MKARSTYVALIALVAVIGVVSGMPKSAVQSLNRIPNQQAEAEGKALAHSINQEAQGEAHADSVVDLQGPHPYNFVDERVYFRDIPTAGDYPLSTSLGTSFDHRIVRLRPLACPHQDETNQPMFHCPTPDLSALTEWKCIRFTDLCNGVPDCPQREDEHPTYCMFHELQNSEVDKLRRIIASMLESTSHHETGEDEDKRRRI